MNVAWLSGLSWSEFVHMSLSPTGELSVSIGPLVIVAALILALLGLGRVIKKKTDWSVAEVTLRIANIGDVKITPDHEIARIAHQAWTELATRKAGIMFEPDHDVITQVYDSWYQLFGELRRLIRSIPAEKLRQSKDARVLVSILVRALNDGLRPHLTRWQARFRRWYEAEEKEYPKKSPQEIQKLYPQYDELKKSLLEVNGQLIELANALRRIAQGKEDNK